MDVPAPRAGKVVSLAVKKGAKVKAGDLILTLAPSDAGASAEAPRPAAQPSAPAQSAGAGAGPQRQAGATGAANASAEAPRTTTQAPAPAVARGASSASPPPRASAPSGDAASGKAQLRFGPRLVVIGSGPGGYTAAFRAADLGLEVTLVE